MFWPLTLSWMKKIVSENCSWSILYKGLTVHCQCWRHNKTWIPSLRQYEHFQPFKIFTQKWNELHGKPTLGPALQVCRRVSRQRGGAGRQRTKAVRSGVTQTRSGFTLYQLQDHTPNLSGPLLLNSKMGIIFATKSCCFVPADCCKVKSSLVAVEATEKHFTV